MLLGIARTNLMRQYTHTPVSHQTLRNQPQPLGVTRSEILLSYTKHVPRQLFTTVYPTGSEAMLHAVESVPHGRTRRRARAASVCERAGHQVVVEGFAEARQGS